MEKRAKPFKQLTNHILMINLNQFFNTQEKELTAIYGVPSSGKTSLCLEIAIKHAKEGKKVIFIDTEKGFSIERFKQLAGENYKQYLEKIIIFTPNSFKDQHTKIQNLAELVEKGNISLIIVDTIGYYYRRFMKNRPELGNRMLMNQLNHLQQISRTIPVLVSNQVYSSFDEKKIKMVGGEILVNRSQRIIELEKEPQRKIILRKPEEKESLFTITDRGFLF